MVINSSQRPRVPRNPITAIMSPDDRIRRDAKAALRYVLAQHDAESLRAFLAELSTLLSKWDRPLQDAGKTSNPRS